MKYSTRIFSSFLQSFFLIYAIIAINMILSFINIPKVPQEVLKTSGFALGFQHFPPYLANVNEWKIMFDTSVNSV